MRNRCTWFSTKPICGRRSGRCKGWEGLLGHIEEIVRRGRVRGFIPWLITQRPAVVHKDVLSQADILIAMKLTASQDRDAIGAWIEGQADRQEGKRILGDLPRLQRGEGYVWAPGHGLLGRVSFPPIGTFDSSRTPKRGERLATPRTLAEVDLTAIIAALAAVETENPVKPRENWQRQAQLERELATAKAQIDTLVQQNRELTAPARTHRGARRGIGADARRRRLAEEGENRDEAGSVAAFVVTSGAADRATARIRPRESC